MGARKGLRQEGEGGSRKQEVRKKEKSLFANRRGMSGRDGRGKNQQGKMRKTTAKKVR